MARVWVVLPGGRVKRFKRPQVMHDCRRRKKGRPVVGVGLCYPLNEARRARRLTTAQLHRSWREAATLDDVDVVTPRVH